MKRFSLIAVAALVLSGCASAPVNEAACKKYAVAISDFEAESTGEVSASKNASFATKLRSEIKPLADDELAEQVEYLAKAIDRYSDLDHLLQLTEEQYNSGKEIARICKAVGVDY